VNLKQNGVMGMRNGLDWMTVMNFGFNDVETSVLLVESQLMTLTL
jgi:hypothetical protein